MPDLVSKSREINLRMAAFALGLPRRKLREKMKMAVGNVVDILPTGQQVKTRKIKDQRLWLLEGENVDEFVENLARDMAEADRHRRGLNQDETF